MVYFVIDAYLLLSYEFSVLVLSQEIGWEERLQNWLLCVGWDVKPQSVRLLDVCCCLCVGDDCVVGVYVSAAGVMDEELRQAEDKFQESKQLAEIAMQNLLDNDVRLSPAFYIHVFTTCLPLCLVVIIMRE